MKNSEGHRDASSERLADFLQAHKDALISDWLTQAGRDGDVPAETLTRLELIDHVPKIFDAIIEAFRGGRSEATMDQLQDVTARHTIIRWAQRYDLRAVVREVSLLRSEFTRRLLTFDDNNPHLSSEARFYHATTIHHILDEIVMDATDTFLNLSARTDGTGA